MTQTLNLSKLDHFHERQPSGIKLTDPSKIHSKTQTLLFSLIFFSIFFFLFARRRDFGALTDRIENVAQCAEFPASQLFLNLESPSSFKASRERNFLADFIDLEIFVKFRVFEDIWKKKCDKDRLLG